MKNLVIGASGQVGKELMIALNHHGNQVIGTYCGTKHKKLIGAKHKKLIQLDITDREQTFAVIEEVNPNCVYLTSALTNVDQCELMPDKSLAINAHGVKNVADALNNHCKLVLFSTDYVFDGKNGPYYPQDICNPINKYGLHKLAAENYISNRLKKYLIVRTCGVFSPRDKKNFASRLVDEILSDQELSIVDDQIGTPTYAPHLAEAVIKHTGYAGYDQKILHISNNLALSRFDFAQSIASCFDKEHLVKRIKSDDIKQMARRPMNCGVHCSPLEVPTLNTAIAHFAKSYKHINERSDT